MKASINATVAEASTNEIKKQHSLLKNCDGEQRLGFERNQSPIEKEYICALQARCKWLDLSHMILL